MGRVLAVDIDSTIWPFDNWMRDAVEKMTGVRLRPQQIDSWDAYERLIGSEAMFAAFDIALDPRRVHNRPLYPGVIEALGALVHMDFDIHFVSKNHEPERIRDPLRRWLSIAMPFEFGLSLTKTEDKLHILRRIEAVGVIDDRPDFLVRARDAGFWAGSKMHPWNQHLDHEIGIFLFSDWSVVPLIVSMSDWESYERELGVTV